MIGRFRTSSQAILAICVLLLSSAATPGVVTAARSPASASAPAAAFTVNSLNDVVADFTNDPGFTVCHTNPTNNVCTLRAAIMNANRNPSGATIIVLTGTYALTIAPQPPHGDDTGSLQISNTVTLVGAGAASTIVDGAGLASVFFIKAGATVTMTGMTIRNGSNLNGAGVESAGQLSLADSIISGNAGHTGGGFSNFGTATLTNDTIEANQAGGGGGGIANSGILAINDSTIADNSSILGGGGLINETTGALTVFNSTISNNSTTGFGGGVDNFGTARFFHTTIAGNLARSNGPAGPNGGGLYNSAPAPTHTLELWNSLIQFNYAGSLPDDCDGQPLTSKDYNFIDSVCPLTGTTTNNVTGLDNHLAPLADNGGPTLTRALLAGSPAIGQIPPGLCRDPFGAAPVPDQRGVPRPVGTKCDMGAYDGALPTPLLGRNLVVNGDAEASAGSPTGAHVGAPGWATSGEFTVVPYNAAGGFPSVPTDTVPANHGANFFAGGNVQVSIGSQDINLAPAAGSIDAGRVRFLLSADLGGFASQEDNATVYIQFLDGASHKIAPSFTIGPVTAAQRGKKTGLLPVNQAGVVPANARTAFVLVTMTRVSNVGPYNDGYADNVSLVLSLPVFLPLVNR